MNTTVDAMTEFRISVATFSFWSRLLILLLLCHEAGALCSLIQSKTSGRREIMKEACMMSFLVKLGYTDIYFSTNIEYLYRLLFSGPCP